MSVLSEMMGFSNSSIQKLYCRDVANKEDFPEIDHCVGENGITELSDRFSELGGNGITELCGNGLSELGGNGITELGGNGFSDLGGNGIVDDYMSNFNLEC